MAGCALCALLYWILSSAEADLNNCGSSMSIAAPISAAACSMQLLLTTISEPYSHN